MTPAVEVNETVVSSMMALSIPTGGDGEPNTDVDVKAQNNWDMWGED